MPARRVCPSLYKLGVAQNAKILLTGCQNIDSLTDPFKVETILGSPSRPVVSPGRDDVDTDLEPSQRELKVWLGNLPDTVVEDVVTVALQDLESQLMVDKDKKLILALINIETIKMNDFFFGIHSLLKILRGFHINNLNVSKRLWCILWEYEEILNRRVLRDAVSSALPHLPFIATLNLAYLADDRMLLTIGRYLPCLNALDISNSSVTDRGLRALAGAASVPPPRTFTVPSPSVVRNLSALLDHTPLFIHQDTVVDKLFVERSGRCLEDTRGGALKLENIRLQTCESITEAGIRFVLENYKSLRQLVYHQRRSVFEILINWCSEMGAEETAANTLKLQHLEHGFPYGIAPFSEQLCRLRNICPHLTNLNLVTEDRVLPHLAGFYELTSLTVELEDCIGEGFISLLDSRGEYLRELSVSCSTDPDAAADNVEGGQQGHLFNLVVLAVATRCSKVSKLSVSGCGLVSSGAVDSLQLLNKLGSSSWIRAEAGNWFRNLEVLMLMSYEDTLPSMTIHSVLLNNILKSVKSLQVLSLEGNFGSFFTDDYMSSILAENAFVELRILDISVNDQGGVRGRIPLTIVAAQALLEKCLTLSELRMSDWNLSDEDMVLLRDLVTANNWELSLTRKLRTI